jgi:hypothetical protein
MKRFEPANGWWDIDVPVLDDLERDSLLAWVAATGYPAEISAAIADRCVDIHHDGWKPASRQLLDLVDASDTGLVRIISDGYETCSYGGILMASANYYWLAGRWNSSYGINRENSFGDIPGLEIRGDVEFACVDIFSSTIDVADVASQVPAVQVNHNPLVRGLAGLETWLWYDFTRPGSPSELAISAQVNARGRTWVLDGLAWIDVIGWDVDCVSNCDFRGMGFAFDWSAVDAEIDFPDTAISPATTYNAGSGDVDGAAARHIYEASGDYVVSTVSRWRGFYTFNDIITLYDPVIVAGSEPYEVVEIRNLLTGSG